MSISTAFFSRRDLIFANEDSPNVTYRSISVCVDRAATAFITCTPSPAQLEHVNAELASDAQA